MAVITATNWQMAQALRYAKGHVEDETGKSVDTQNTNIINVGVEAMTMLTEWIALQQPLRSPSPGSWLVPSQSAAKHYLATPTTCTCDFGRKGSRRAGHVCKHMFIADMMEDVLSAARYCPECGSVTDPESLVCEQCGAMLDREPEQTLQPAYVPPVPDADSHDDNDWAAGIDLF